MCAFAFLTPGNDVFIDFFAKFPAALQRDDSQLTNRDGFFEIDVELTHDLPPYF